MVKICSKCNKELTINMFGLKRDKLQSYCKKCQKEYAKEHYNNNKKYYVKKHVKEQTNY